MRCVLAIDSGGTKCDAVLARDDGVILGRGYCDFRDPQSGRGLSGSGRSAQSTMAATTQAMGDHPCGELHLTVVGPTISKRMRPHLGERRVRVHVVNEEEAVLATAGEDAGVVVLAGTGSFITGRTRDGRHVHLDGIGPMVGDYGSGYHIGLLAIRAAARAHWHPRHTTTLATSVPEALCNNGKNEFYGLTDLFSRNPPDRSIIASLAKLVNDEAEAGDALARKLLEIAAGAMAETLRDVVDRLEIAHEEYAMIGAGSIPTRSTIYWNHLCKLAGDFAPGLQPVIPSLPPVFGMALVTLRAISDLDPNRLLDNLLRSARDLPASNGGGTGTSHKGSHTP